MAPQYLHDCKSSTWAQNKFHFQAYYAQLSQILDFYEFKWQSFLNGQLIQMLWGGRGKKWRCLIGKIHDSIYLGQRRIVCDHPCTHNPPWLYPRIHCQIYLILFYKWRNIKLKQRLFFFAFKTDSLKLFLSPCHFHQLKWIQKWNLCDIVYREKEALHRHLKAYWDD